MNRLLRLTLLVAMIGIASAQGPSVGYLFPAGGRKGTSFEVIAGGQRLYGVKELLVTGQGVEIEMIQHYRPVRNLNGDQRRLLVQMIQNRQDQLDGKPKKALPAGKPRSGAKGKLDGTQKGEAKKKEEAPPILLPSHPRLEGIEAMSARELEVVRRTFLKANRNQLNPQIAEMMKLRVTVSADAEPGDRMIRAVSPQGLSNEICFQVGALPEWSEREPNEAKNFPGLEPLPPVDLPVVVNGQILPGDVDRIRFRAKKGEPLVVDARARRLIPYLADAVPGWFQIVVGLLDEKGNEIAYADDFRFHPDPLFRYLIPADGIYQLEVRDSIYRGRQDFVYRIRLGRLPVITEMFPLGTAQGRSIEAGVRGWNLPSRTVRLDAGAAGGALRHVSLQRDGLRANGVPYMVDSRTPDGMSQVTEVEPNGSLSAPQVVSLPTMINGRIGEPGDLDVFRIKGERSQEVVAEIQARGLSSPLDSKLSLIDSRGTVVAWNDDHMEKDGHLHLGTGLVTHHADSYLRATLPEDGVYYLVVGDSQGHGGPSFAYRLRISAPRPGFRVMASPSTVLAPNGGHAALRFHVAREDGFDGAVEVALLDAPKGYRLHGAVIPAGKDQVRATLEAPAKRIDGVVELKFQALATHLGKELSVGVIPADDRMQAFLWRHLVTTDRFLVMPKGSRQYGLSLKSTERSRLKSGGSVDVRIVAREGSLPDRLMLELREPPEGISVGASGVLSDGFFLTVRAEDSVEPGLLESLIVEAWMESQAKPGKKAGRRQFVGTLPPIPIQLIDP